MKEILNHWEVWTGIYLVSAIIFAHSFKKANKSMKNAGSLTILLEFFTILFAIPFIPFFEMKFPVEPTIYLTLFTVTIIYAVTDRLNIEARYGLDPSIFSMLKQLSTVFLIIFGFFFLKEEVTWNKLTGAIIIILANLLLSFEKGKIKLNKYFIMSFVSNFLFAIAMLINVNISDHFNLAIYTMLTLSIPALLIFIFEKHNLKELKQEWNLYSKKTFLVASLTWCLMLISSVKAYQLGDITVVAPLFALTAILNALIEFIFTHNKNKFIQKIIAAILVIAGVILIRI